MALCSSSSSSHGVTTQHKQQQQHHQQHLRSLAVWLQLLLLTSQLPHFAAGVTPPGGGSSTSLISTNHYSMPIIQQSVPARYCPNGGTIEGGLCYPRCKVGWRGLACHCWKGVESYKRGCGVKPAVCHAMSYRKQLLPPVTSREPFSLVLSADPQLFRVVNKFKAPHKALHYNKQLVRSINRVQELQTWPWESGGGEVQDPRALVVLGDMTEFYREDELDAFRSMYDPSIEPPPADTPSAPPANTTSNSSSSSIIGGVQQQQQRQQQQQLQQQDPREASTPTQVALPTWLMFGNHDIALNINDCAGHFKSTDRNVCARTAVDTMRSVLMPGCDDTTWANFPRGNVTSFDADSLAYSFDYNNWHFVVLQYSPRYEDSSVSVKSSLGWLAAELSSATAQQRRIVLLLHAHRELGLALDPTFSRLVANSNVVAIFYGHVHIKPWGMTGNFPNTNVPMFNCGASWYHVYCYAEFGTDTLRVAAVTHNATGGSSAPQWFGTSVHALLKQQKAKPVLLQFTQNPNQTWTNAAGAGWRQQGAGGLRSPLLVSFMVMLLVLLL